MSILIHSGVSHVLLIGRWRDMVSILLLNTCVYSRVYIRYCLRKINIMSLGFDMILLTLNFNILYLFRLHLLILSSLLFFLW